MKSYSNSGQNILYIDYSSSKMSRGDSSSTSDPYYVQDVLQEPTIITELPEFYTDCEYGTLANELAIEEIGRRLIEKNHELYHRLAR